MNTPVGDAAGSTDTASPSVSISSPTSGGSYTTSASQVAVSGAASDNVGVASVQWSNSRGGSGTAAGTTSWSVSAIPLQSGTNVLTFTAADAANNTATTTLTVVSNSTAGASRLSVSTQPSASAASGATFSQQPVVQLVDANGNVVAQSGVAVTASIASGGGALGGATTTTTNANGVATFSDLSISGTVGSRTLGFSSTSASAATSNAINVVAGAASKLVISAIGTQATNTPFNVTVALTDASNNPVNNSGRTGTITLSRQAGTGTLSGTTTGTIPIGSNSVTISGVTYSTAESNVTLLATGSGSRSTMSGKSGTSNSFAVSAGSQQSGGDSGSGSGSGANTYSTNFPASESPISEGGRWLNGGTDGIDWSNVWTTSGQAIGHQVSASYTDATAILKGSWGPNQQVTATVFNSGTLNDNCGSEVEMRLRTSISAHNNHGYEISYAVSQAPGAYLIIVRWNGALGDFTYLLRKEGTQYGVKNGDVVSVKMVGNVITAYKNGVVMGQATDNTYGSGSPGMGFNLENGPAGCSGTNNRYGYTQFSASDGATP
jgi:hypothetical protein